MHGDNSCGVPNGKMSNFLKKHAYVECDKMTVAWLLQDVDGTKRPSDEMTGNNLSPYRVSTSILASRTGISLVLANMES